MTRGLDLLGLRQSVQAVGESLLNGVITTTPTIRYISFRAWTAYIYSQLRLPNDRKSFDEMWTHIEAAIALATLLTNKDATGAVGVTDGRELIDSGIDPIPLRPLVKQSAARIYGGTSDQLGISFEAESGIPGLTRERGLVLAEEVDRVLNETELGRRIRTNGYIQYASRQEIAEFGSACSISDLQDAEIDILTASLLPLNPLKTELPRLATYTSLLSLAGQLGREPDESDLFSAAISLERTLPSELHFILDGWLRYCIRDTIALAHEKVLSEVLEAIRRLEDSESAIIPRGVVIDELLGHKDDYRDSLTRLGLAGPDTSVLTLPFRNLYDRVWLKIAKQCRDDHGLQRWSSEINELTLVAELRRAGTASLVLLPVVWILACLRTLPSQETDDRELTVLSHQGWARIGLFQIIRPSVSRFLNESMTVGEVIQHLLLRTVDQHLRVSWSRLSADPKKDVALMTTDEDHWILRRERDFVADRTASRIPQAVGWLRQLKLIGVSGLTDSGISVLQRSIDTLRRTQHESS